VAVPAELRGLEMAWKKWGRLKWQELLQPAIDLARNGFPVSPEIKRAIQYKKDFLTTGKFPGLQ
jgi:gamma-glutamyltranspeptidase